MKSYHLKEKIIVGVSTTTSNNDPKMGQIIGGLWERLYQGGINAVIKKRLTSMRLDFIQTIQTTNIRYSRE